MLKMSEIRYANIKNQNLNEQLLNTIKKTTTFFGNIFLYSVLPSNFFILLIRLSASKSFKSNLFKLLIDDADAIVDEVTVETDDHTNSLDRKHVDLIEGKSRSDTPINNNLPEDEIKNKRYWDWNAFAPCLPYIVLAVLAVVSVYNSGMTTQLLGDMISTKGLINETIQHQTDNFKCIDGLTRSITNLFHKFQNSGNSSRDNNNE